MFEGVYMTKKEIARADIFARIAQKKITKAQAAKVLRVSPRQLYRLYDAFLANGMSSLVSRKRGKPSNHQLPTLIKARISELVTCEAYREFGPTFMCEKLEQFHNIKVCPETTRQLMIQSGVWHAHAKKCPVIHQQRQRRARFGELTQVDGSPHHWLEDRGPLCVLIVFIDDATGQTYGKLFESETTQAYMETLWEYILIYGLMQSIYSDKYGVFRINMPGCIKKECLTQFARALKELDIKLMCANSPQAKGRVERANQTHQDRLVKELRLARINTIEEANRFLPGYWEKHNKKFAVSPKESYNAHREIPSDYILEDIFCYKNSRKTTKNLEIQYKNIIYQIILENPSKTLQRAQVTILESLDGKISIEYKGKKLPFKIYSEQEFLGGIVNSKEIDRFLQEPTKRKVSNQHPWK